MAWEKFSEPALAQAYVQKRPVLIEFTADWCLNCKVLEKSVFSKPVVASRLGAGNGVPAFVMDMTEYDEAQQKVLERYGGTALPYSVVLTPDDKVFAALSGMFTVEMLVEVLDRVTDKSAGNAAN